MGCTASVAVAPDSNVDTRPASPATVTPAPHGASSAVASALEGVSSAVTAENVVQFTDEAAVVLETISATPDVVANFSQFLQDHAGDLKDALGAIAGTAVKFASVSAHAE
jgi:hypothetical protein